MTEEEINKAKEDIIRDIIRLVFDSSQPHRTEEEALQLLKGAKKIAEYVNHKRDISFEMLNK